MAKKTASIFSTLQKTAENAAAVNSELVRSLPVEALEGNLQYQFNVEELQDVLLVDWRAVDSENGKSYVYVLEDDMVQKRYVAPGLNNREKVWILDGLHEGQTVIAD